MELFDYFINATINGVMGPLLVINGFIDGHLGLQPLEMEFVHPAYNW